MQFSSYVRPNSSYPMKRLLALFSLLTVAVFAADVAKITPAEAAKLVAEGKAVIIDVREADEWAESGVASPAVLLAKSEFDEGLVGEWKPFLEKNKDKQIITYCRSGGRATTVAAELEKKGYRVAVAGSLKDWQAAGLSTRKASEPAQ
jgi:rhodanese-related sulfurtransferase